MLQYLFYVKNKTKQKTDFLWCFSACFINMVLQYLRQLHNLSSFFIISHKPSDLYYYMNGLFLLFIIIITKRNFRLFLSIISFLYHNDHIEMIEILWFKCSLLA